MDNQTRLAIDTLAQCVKELTTTVVGTRAGTGAILGKIYRDLDKLQDDVRTVS